MIDPGVLVRRIRSLAPAVPFTTGFFADEDEAKVSGFNEGKTAALFEVFKLLPYAEVEKLGRQGIAEAATYCCDVVHHRRFHGLKQAAPQGAMDPSFLVPPKMHVTCNKCGKEHLSWRKRSIGGSPEVWNLWSEEQGWHFDVCPARVPRTLDSLVEHKTTNTVIQGRPFTGKWDPPPEPGP